MARGAQGSRMFQTIYVQRQDDGAVLEVTNGGELSCAYFVSAILCLFDLIDRPHATVATTLQKMAEAGWQRIDGPRPGAVIHWPVNQGHEHIGIVLEDGQCISNSMSERTPQIHGPRLGDGREPDAYYWHSNLE